MLGEIVSLSTLILTNAGINVGIYRYFNARLSRVYERLDIVKNEVDEKYVRKNLCDVMHQQNAVNLTGLETRLTERFNKLEGETRDNFNRILSLLTDKK